MDDKYLKDMESEYDYHEKKGNLFKVRHLKITIEDFGWTKWKSTPKFPPAVKKDYDFILGLEKRLMENSDDGYGYELTKSEMKKCNALYNIYSKDLSDKEAYKPKFKFEESLWDNVTMVTPD